MDQVQGASSGMGLQWCDDWERGLRESGGIFDDEGVKGVGKEADFLFYVGLNDCLLGRFFPMGSEWSL